MTLEAALLSHGLRILGHCPDGEDSVTLIGPDEPRFWPLFTASAEYRDGQPDPLDRWSLRVLTRLAKNHDAQPIFPFGGPPYAPFHRWALQSGLCWTSPIGFLVHQDAGLFVSFRGALRHPATTKTAAQATAPCETCPQPCLAACPVDAFAQGYDVAACKAHVASPGGADCRTAGCLARRACPLGQGLRRPAQSAFHMRAFL